MLKRCPNLTIHLWIWNQKYAKRKPLRYGYHSIISNEKFEDNSERCTKQKPDKEVIADGGSAYFKWDQNCIDTTRQATYAMKNSK